MIVEVISVMKWMSYTLRWKNDRVCGPPSDCNVLYCSAFLASGGILIWVYCVTTGAFYASQHEILTYIFFFMCI